jgi:hypothetical protein
MSNKYANMFNQPNPQTNPQQRSSVFGQSNQRNPQFNPIQPQRQSVFQQSNQIQPSQPNQSFQPMGGKSVFTSNQTQQVKPIQSRTSIFDRQNPVVSFDPANIFGQKEINVINDYDMEMEDEDTSSKPKTNKPRSTNMTEQEHLEEIMNIYGVIKII